MNEIDKIKLEIEKIKKMLWILTNKPSEPTDKKDENS